MSQGTTANKPPDKRDRSWFSRWSPDPQTVVSQAISIAIHIVLLVTIAVWIAYAPARDKIIPAEVDVIEFEEPQQSEGPPDAPPDEVDLGQAQEIEREVVDVTEPKVPDMPEIDLPTPVVPEEEPPEIDPDKYADQLDALDRTISQLQRNVEQSGGGDSATDPDSRGAQQKRWTITYTDMNCGEFPRMIKDIGMEELGMITGKMKLVYIEPESERLRRGLVDSETRMFWGSSAGRLGRCEDAIFRRAGYQPTQVIWFMARSEEQTLKDLEAKHAAQHGLDIDDIARTEFVPRRIGGRWKLEVKSMR